MTDGSRYISHDADGGREGTATPGEPAAASVGPMRYRDTRAITDGAGEAAAVETSAAPVTAPPPLVTDGSPRAASPSDAEVAASGADGGFGFHYQPGRGDVLRPSGNGARDRGDGPPPDPKKPGPTVGSEWVHHVRGESGGVESRPSAAGYVLSDPTPEGGRHSAPLNNAEKVGRGSGVLHSLRPSDETSVQRQQDREHQKKADKQAAASTCNHSKTDRGVGFVDGVYEGDPDVQAHSEMETLPTSGRATGSFYRETSVPSSSGSTTVEDSGLRAEITFGPGRLVREVSLLRDPTPGSCMQSPFTAARANSSGSGAVEHCEQLPPMHRVDFGYDSIRSAPGGSLQRDSTQTTVSSDKSWEVLPRAEDGCGEEDSIILSSARSDSVLCRRRKVNLLIDQCESARFPFKKKLILSNMNLTVTDLPVNDVCSPSLCHSLHKLSLAGNRLVHIPGDLVLQLTGLRTLDVSQCDLRVLPNNWNLPHLKRLDLSHNHLDEFPCEEICFGLPELQHLDMYGNKVSEITIPSDAHALARLDHLNLGYNNLRGLPEKLNRLISLRTLKVMNNALEKIPEEVCDMDLRIIDISSNPLIQPPVETCERGICSMRRYYHCINLEERARQKMIEEMHRKAKAKKSRGRVSRLGSVRRKKDSILSLRRFNPRAVGDNVDVATLSLAGTASPSSSLLSIQPPLSALGSSDRARTVPLVRGGESRPLPQSAVGRSTSSSTARTVELSHLRSKRVSAPTPKHRPVTVATKVLPHHGLSFDLPLEKRILDYPARAACAPDDKPSISDSGPSKSSAGSAASSVDDDLLKGEAEPFYNDVIMSGITNETDLDTELLDLDLDDTVNDTLKVIFVGMACAGKTSMIKRLIEGRGAKIPKQEERTIGVDIYEWDPKNDGNNDRNHVDTRIMIEDDLLGRTNGDVDVKFSVWDFAGQHVYHATHELFFSPRALYVLVWDMGASNLDTQRKNREREEDQGAFKLSYDSTDDEDEDFMSDDEVRRADRALERDIDEKVQFWVDCIQSSAPGAAILPVASFDDFFENNEGLNTDEAKRRCNMMKQRLLKHEERKVKGLMQRLAEYEQGHRANSESALRLRHLLSPFYRPKLIFGVSYDNSTVRVSCTKYRGFDHLTEKIVNIATGREKGRFAYPLFRGHVGARIPRMRLEVRDVVRNMRDRFKVVEWGYFLSTLREKGLDSVEDVSDALHFLTNIGELSYFGEVAMDHIVGRQKADQVNIDDGDDAHEDEDEDYEEEDFFVMDKYNNRENSKETTNFLSPSAFPSVENTPLAYGLSQFVFLNPRWLVAAVACILRHDLTREINETRRLFNKEALVGWDSGVLRGGTFYEAHLNCPVITAVDACMLWQAKKMTKKAAERAQEYSNNVTMTPFDFLQRLLVRFRVFVPIDLSIDKTLLGGKEYGLSGENPQIAEGTLDTDRNEGTPQFFFLPSLLGPGEPAKAWTYKNSDSWKTTICHSILFPDGVAPGLMERITATVLSDVYAATQSQIESEKGEDDQKQPVRLPQSINSDSFCRHGAHNMGLLHVKEILCWRSAFFLKMGMEVADAEGREATVSVAEIFCALVDRESHLCVGSDSMGVGTRRLVLSGKGQVGEGGKKIWEGGYTSVTRAIERVMEEYGGLEFEKQGICPECLAKRPVSRASVWDCTLIRSAAQKGDESMWCQYGHRVDRRLISGMYSAKSKPVMISKDPKPLLGGDPIVPVAELLRGVVVVGLWDGKSEKLVRVGSGFIVDRKRGLIVTASHTLMNIWGDSKSPYGENYYGLRSGKVVIGIIPRDRSKYSVDETTAVFRYFAQIVAKDDNIEARGVCHMDACVLQITTKMEQDVGGDGDGCGKEVETILWDKPDALKKEKLRQLKVASKECELDEQVRILGYNQGGEGLIKPGSHVNRCADFARGYVCMKFHTDVKEGWSKSRRFQPKEEIVVICPTIGGHSGGPCVNQSGEVIGILSRADPTEKQRCYLVPATAWRGLVRKAKRSPY